jgi:hypothetical protein
MNRDLRTVIEHEPVRKEKEEAASSSNERVDVAGLGVPGVPRDVSAEEIAAIAAAAAQVQGATTAHEPDKDQASDAKSTSEREAAPAFEGASEKQASGEEKVEGRAGMEAETATDHIESAATPAEVSPAATLAPTKSEMTGAPGSEDDGKADQDRSETAGATVAHAAAIAAVAALEPANGQSWADSPYAGVAQETTEIPVTMAVGSAAGYEGESRWMAVPAAVDPSEAAISLELEMEKAYAAFAAAEGDSRGYVSRVPETVAPVEDAVAPLPEPLTAPQETVAESPYLAGALPEVPEAVTTASAAPESVVAAPEPELANSMEAVANPSADALGGAVTELAALAASHAEGTNEAPPEIEQSAGAMAGEAISDSPSGAEAEIVSGHSVGTPPPQTEGSAGTAAEAVSLAPQEPSEEVRMAEPIVGEAAAAVESAVGGMGHMAEKTESELAASTAAAWASWRQIRETAHPQDEDHPSQRESGIDESSDSAAMAAAAGADDASGGDGADPTAIASIVDSVLADLRPKIVEEISRKLGKKK